MEPKITLEKPIRSPTSDLLVKPKSLVDSLLETVVLPNRFPAMFPPSRRPWGGVLLYGPSGCGKAYLARWCACEAHCSLIDTDLAELCGAKEPAKLVKETFALALANQPCILLFRHLEALETKDRSLIEMKSEFLTRIEGVNMDAKLLITVISTAISPWVLSCTMRRRHSSRRFVRSPAEDERRRMLDIGLKDVMTDINEPEMGEIVTMTYGYTYEELEKLVQFTVLRTLNKQARSSEPKLTPRVTKKDIVEIMGKQVRPAGISGATEKLYAGWTQEFTNGG